MRALKPSTFVKSIEYATERVLRKFGFREPQSYRLSNSQITEPKYYFVMKGLGGSK